jgi:HlyD family secretion protein
MKYNALLLFSALAFMSCNKQEKISLVTEEVTTGDISESVTATGTIESVTSVDVGTQVTGIVDKIYVDYNSEVKKGDLIAEIDKVTLQSELQSADANVASSKATYDYTLTNYNRDKKLHDSQLISDYEFDTSKRDLQIAKTAYEKALADRVKASKNLQYAEIYAPIDGIVVSRDVEVGQTVVSSMTVANLFTIADLDNMQVTANVDEADIGQVKEGQHVTFTVDAYPNDVFEGTVIQKRISPTTESNVVTYEVIVSAANPEHKLIPGLTANLTIYMSQNTDVLLVPLKATRFIPHEYPDVKGLPAIQSGASTEAYKSDDATKKQVWVLRDNTLVPTIITVGTNNGVSYMVESGLKKGDKVAIEYSADAQEVEETTETASSPFTPTPPGKKK